jgi:hypothetical protein
MATPVDFDRRDLDFSRCDACCADLRWIDLLCLDETYSGFLCDLIVGSFDLAER